MLVAFDILKSLYIKFMDSTKNRLNQRRIEYVIDHLSVWIHGREEFPRAERNSRWRI